MAGKTTKAAKKFGQRNGLAKLVKHRKFKQTLKRAKQVRPNADDEQHTTTDAVTTTANPTKPVTELTVDELLSADYFDTDAAGGQQSETDAGDSSDDELAQLQDVSDDDQPDTTTPPAAAATTINNNNDGDDSDSDGDILPADSDDNDSSDEDGDEEVDAEQLQKDIELHQKQLSELSKTDPEFYKHLQTNEANLLTMQDDNDDGSDAGEQQNDDDDDDGEGEDADNADDRRTSVLDRLTDQQFKRIKSIITTTKPIDKQQKLTAAKQIVKLVRAVTRVSDESIDTLDHTAQKLHTDIIRFTFLHITPIFNVLLPSGVTVDKCIKLDKSNRAVKSLVYSLIKYIERIVKQSNTNSNVMVRFCLTHIQHIGNLINLFDKLSERLIRNCVTLWCEADQFSRIDAFLLIRRVCLSMSSTHILPYTLKHTYLSYVRAVKYTTPYNEPVVEFMCNCLVELYSIDPVQSYQHMYIYIRQLAIHLRAAIQNKTKESHKSVYNWQFVNSLRCWCRVLCTHATKPTDTLYPLIYPFVQITTSTISLLPTIQYLPLRIQLCTYLIQITRSCHVYIPLLSQLLAMFNQLTTNNIKTVKSTTQIGDLKCQLRVNKSLTKHITYHIAALRLVTDAIEAYCTLMSYSIAYTELVTPLLFHLRRFCKRTKLIKVKKQCQTLIQHIDANSVWCEARRTDRKVVDYSPADMLKNGTDVLFTFKDDGVVSPLQLIHDKTKSTDSTPPVSGKQVDWTGTGSSGSKGKQQQHHQQRDGAESSDEEHDDNDDVDDSDAESGGDEDRPSAPTKHSNKAGNNKANGKHQRITADSDHMTPNKKQARRVAADADETEDVVQEMTLSDVDD